MSNKMMGLKAPLKEISSEERRKKMMNIEMIIREKREIKLFKFESLNEKVKEKIRENYLKSENDNINEYIEEWIKEELEKLGLEDLEYGYQITFNQGDGVEFKGEFLIEDTLESEIIKMNFTEEEMKMLMDISEWLIYGREFLEYGEYINYGLTVKNDEEFEELGLNYSYEEYEKIYKKFVMVISNSLKEVERKILKVGYELLSPSDKELAIIYIDYLFTENGEMYEITDIKEDDIIYKKENKNE